MDKVKQFRKEYEALCEKYGCSIENYTMYDYNYDGELYVLYDELMIYSHEENEYYQLVEEVDYYHYLGDVVAHLRKKKSMGIDELARRAKVKQKDLIRCEGNQFVFTYEEYNRLFAALETSFEEVTELIRSDYNAHDDVDIRRILNLIDALHVQKELSKIKEE